MPDKRVNSEEKPTSEPPQDEARHEDADEHIEMQENVDVNHNGHQEPEELDKSIEGELSYTLSNQTKMPESVHII